MSIFNKKKKILTFSLTLGVILALLIQYYGFSQERLKAAPAGATYTIDNPEIKKVSASGSEEEISGDYGFMLKIQDDTSYESFSAVEVPYMSTYKSKIFRFDKNAVGGGVWIYNAGFYNGKKIDVKLVIDEINFKNNNYFNFFALDPSEAKNSARKDYPVSDSTAKIWEEVFLLAGSSNNPVSGFFERYTAGDSVNYHYEFYEHGNKTNPFKLKGSWNYGNVNQLKSAKLPFNNDFKNIYVRDTSVVSYVENMPAAGNLELYGDGTNINHDDNRLTYLFEGTEYATSMVMRHDRDTPMAIYYSNESLARIAPARPIVIGEKNSAGYLDSGYQELRYSILQNVMDNKKENRNSTFKLETEVPSFYDIETVIAYEYGRSVDVSDRFDIALKGNKAVLTAKDSTSDEFNGQVYEVKVIAKPNASFSFDKSNPVYNYQESGVDAGHMIFDEGGPITNTHYTYNDPKNPSQIKFENILDSWDADGKANGNEDLSYLNQSLAKVRYDGKPLADPQANITFPVGTDFSTMTKDEILASLIENLRTDTNNPSLDGDISVSIDTTQLPDTSVAADEVFVWVDLVTDQGVPNKIKVPVEIKQNKEDVTVRFVDNAGNEIDASKYPPVVFPQQTVGTTVDLTKNDEIKNTLADLYDAGYDKQTPGFNEAAVTVESGGTQVDYVFVKALATVTVKFVDLLGTKEIETAVKLENKEVKTSIDLKAEKAVTDILDKILADGTYTLKTPPTNEAAVLVERGGATVEYVYELAAANLTVRFVDSSGVEISGYSSFVKAGKVTDEVDLTKIDEVKQTLKDLYDAGYDKQTPAFTETAVVIKPGGTIVDYVFDKALTTVTVKFINSITGSEIETAVRLENREVGTPVNLQLETAVTDVLQAINTDGKYNLTASPSNETSVSVVRGGVVVEYMFVPSDAALVVNFVDEDGEIAPTIALNRQVGDIVDLTDTTKADTKAVVDQIVELEKTYRLPSRPANEKNVTVEVGTTTVTYTFTGRLLFISAPKVIDFGIHEITPTALRVNKPETMDDDLAVQDTRSARTNWTLTAKVTKEMTHEGDTSKVIPEALRYVYKGNEVVLKSDAEIVMTRTNDDKQPYNVNSTWTEDGDGLKLEAEIGTVKKSGAYQGTILWELAETP